MRPRLRSCGAPSRSSSLALRAGSLLRQDGERGALAGLQNGARNRGRAFKFSEAQATEFRTRVEGGKSAAELAKELKVSLPTMYNTLKRAGWSARGGPRAKRGRAFKFSDEQAGSFRKRVEGGASAATLAKEAKVSLPTMYSTLKRAGWKARRPRAA